MTSRYSEALFLKSTTTCKTMLLLVGSRHLTLFAAVQPLHTPVLQGTRDKFCSETIYKEEIHTAI